MLRDPRVLMLKDSMILALAVATTYLGLQAYGQRELKESTLVYMESRVAELDRLEVIWKEAINRCLAD